MRFDDYHRTIVGYHGTRLSVALEIVANRRRFDPSRNDHDWLGHGIYFWEYAPQQALRWAEDRASRQGWNEPIAVVASMIRLGYCFDLLDPYNVEVLDAFHAEYRDVELHGGGRLPTNVRSSKRLDCAVFKYACAAVEGQSTVDSVRAVYVPAGSGKRVWPQSWISRDAHVQVCVRNPACILGTWLHHPAEWSIDDGTERPEDSRDAEVGDEPAASKGRAATPEDAHGGQDPAPGQGGTPLPG